MRNLNRPAQVSASMTGRLRKILFFGIVGSLWIISCSRSQPPAVDIVESQPIEPPVLRQIQLEWAYINRDIKWESPPKQIAQTFKGSRNSRIVIFYPNGDYAQVGCTIYWDNKTQQMILSAGDDFSVLKGTWTQNDDGTIATRSRMTHGMVVNYPDEDRTWKIRERSTARLANSFETGGEVFTVLQKIGNFDTLPAMIADENKPPK